MHHNRYRFKEQQEATASSVTANHQCFLYNLPWHVNTLTSKSALTGECGWPKCTQRYLLPPISQLRLLLPLPGQGNIS